MNTWRAGRAAALLASIVVLASPTPSSAGEGPPEAPAETDTRTFLTKVLGFSGLVGRVKAEKLTYWGFPPFTGLKCRLTITKDGDWRFENTTARVSGGRMVNAQSVIDFDPPSASGPFRGPKARKRKGLREFRVAAEFVDVRLEEFSRHMGAPVTPGEVTGHAALRITSEGRKGLSGRAAIHLRRGDLGRLPFVVKTLSFLTLSGFSKKPIEEADARITIAPRALVFEELVLRTRDGGFKIVAERGGPRSGYITYDGRLDFHFRPSFTSEFLEALGTVPGGDIVVKLLAAFKERGGRVRVTGTAKEPKFQWAAFR